MWNSLLGMLKIEILSQNRIKVTKEDVIAPYTGLDMNKDHYMFDLTLFIVDSWNMNELTRLKRKLL